jgi:phosphohistidine phosphatase
MPPRQDPLDYVRLGADRGAQTGSRRAGGRRRGAGAARWTSESPRSLTAGPRRRHRPGVPLVLDLLRHGHALPADEGGDDLRRLSPRGRADLEHLAGRLKTIGWHPDRVFTSPLARARESALVTLRGAAPDRRPEPMEALRPESHPSEVVAALEAEGATTGHLLLVGHQPLMGLLAALLIAGSPPGFATGTLQRIEFTGALAPGSGVASLRLAPGAA